MTTSEIKKKYIRIEEHPAYEDGECFGVRLVIDQQTFPLDYVGTKQECGWYADMLAKALKRMIEEGKE